ncbi:SDR family oxidoreductase [Alcaligenaceae bacterium 429]|uniref:SDR family oxidoreductase n=1 Tax=Paenalcaligenes sp. Me52 TaxID=3392038 RepID=UPI001092AE1B|nr:SDR family oxidoreductase [Alcaligenaceae bacterium 429]
MKLQHKVAVITGAASGIGAATAQLFAAEGASVVVADKDLVAAQTLVQSLVMTVGASALAVQVDVADSISVQQMLQRTQDHFGRVDVLVNNAGFGLASTVENTSEDDWTRLMRVNVDGVFYGCKYVIPMMRQQGGGVIVNTASVAGLVGLRERAAYCASKGAVIALTRAMALDHAAENIRVNCVAPGTVQSPYFTDMLAKAEDPQALLQQLSARQPVMRLGQPEEIAKAILFLASADSSFSVGSVLVTDGGLSAA